MIVSRGAGFSAGMTAVATIMTMTAACSSSPDPTSSRGVTGASTNTSTGRAGSGASSTSDGWSSSTTGSGGAISYSPNNAATGAAGVPPLRDGQCAGGDIPARRVTPTVWLVLDGSGSMNELLEADKSRWMALREALMDPAAGVVKSLEHDIHWGMVMYDGPLPFGVPPTPLPDGGMSASTATTECPRLVTVPPMQDNFSTIEMAYPADPLGGSTPTDMALEAVLAQMPNAGAPQLDTIVQPTILVLATDGEPNDFCSGAFGKDSPQAVLTAVGKLAAVNVPTYVISLAGADMRLTQHLTQVAQSGNTGKAPFIPTSKDQLVQTFRDIIGPPRACDIVLQGSIVAGSECKGTIQINGQVVPCNDPNGWVLKDPSTITLQGTGCESYKLDTEAYISADFPCEAISVN